MKIFRTFLNKRVAYYRVICYNIIVNKKYTKGGT
uniref:Uncharacterized protein n=1 Tax=Siphoviridae sp. ctaDn21 TaxID=2825563 RepID=A0A8S5UV73_9CAUD|nr:MAG TPA: hypothetical protein [Siphoviridae sp. ctaDn21]